MLDKHDLNKNSFGGISEQDSEIQTYQILQKKMGLTEAKSAAIVELYSDLKQSLTIRKDSIDERLSVLLDHSFSSMDDGSSSFSSLLIRSETFLDKEIDLLLEFVNTLEYNLGIDEFYVPYIFRVLM